MKQWNKALEELELRLATEIDVAVLARYAATSEYHFRRMFSSLAGMPLSEYIRRRRLTVSAAQIVAGDPVLEVAIRYGYNSAEAFGRAFKAMHGMTPSQAREPGATLHSQPQLRFHLTVEGTHEMTHRIENKPDFFLIGAKTTVPLVYSGANPAIEEFERSLPKDLDDRLLPLSNTTPQGRLTATETQGPDAVEGSPVEYWHAVAGQGPIPEGFDSRLIPQGLWVVFEGHGAFPEVLQNLWASAATEFFPANPYRWIPGPQLLKVTSDTGGRSGSGELWIPIERE
ncbi:helix-turn-helix domain-containing protein [Glutamicibacter sp. PS]|uniref:AraC family transcriptional regulator n=1 Tax=Glutamicibacter sp. PS TaxID=3075634 RepID=UPI00283F665A|nr:helix-turn-helix domain-containing protein [Glutamicibacter sp. PS]MDR4534238.1 helix-turn-helix domain-containing protein [Glutamicibacter sp. PS]